MLFYYLGKDKDAARPGLTADGRVATVIHEATHFLSKTGDNVHKTGNDIIPGGDFTSPPHDTKTGCTSFPLRSILQHQLTAVLRYE